MMPAPAPQPTAAESTNLMTPERVEVPACPWFPPYPLAFPALVEPMTQGIPDRREQPTILGHQVVITATLQEQSNSNPGGTGSDNRSTLLIETGEDGK